MLVRRRKGSVSDLRVRAEELDRSEPFESPDAFWLICSYRDAGLLCTGTSQPLVHPDIRHSVRVSVGLRISSGRLALRFD